MQGLRARQADGHLEHTMTPRELVQSWVEAFNLGNAGALADFYSDDAVNHQVAEEPVVGRNAIREMFAAAFAKAKMVCMVEHIFQEGEWAILEWRDPLGLRGCGFFHTSSTARSFFSADTGTSSHSCGFMAYRFPLDRPSAIDI